MYEHKRQLFAFVLVAVICAIVVGTTMKSQAILGLINPDRPPTAAAPHEAVTPAPVEVSRTPAADPEPQVTSAPVVQADDVPASQPSEQTRSNPRQPKGNNHSPNGTTGNSGDRHPDHDTANPGSSPHSPQGPKDRDPTEGFTVIEAISGPRIPVTEPPAPVTGPPAPSPAPSPSPSPSPSSPIDPVVPDSGE